MNYFQIFKICKHSLKKTEKKLEFWGHKLKRCLFLSIQGNVTMPVCLKKNIGSLQRINNVKGVYA